MIMTQEGLSKRRAVFHDAANRSARVPVRRAEATTVLSCESKDAVASPLSCRFAESQEDVRPEGLKGLAHHSEAADMKDLSSPQPTSHYPEASITSPSSSLQDTMQVVATFQIT